MLLKFLVIFALLHASQCHRYQCSEKSALHLLKRPIYDYSIKILDRVAQNNDAHFVFSPLSSWLQLAALAEGAKGRTFRELWFLTRHSRNRCFKKKLRQILRNQNENLSAEYRRKNVIVVDKFMGVKKRFMRDVMQFYDVKVLLKNFDRAEESALAVNRFVAGGTDGIIDESIYIDDFNSSMSMLLSDNVVFRSAWRYPFDPARTKKAAFSTTGGALLGHVNMMSFTGSLNVTELPIIKARVLEIPCVGHFSMLILMPLKKTSIYDTFYNMNRTTLASIFNSFRSEGEKLVEVKLPRFSINSTVGNMAELLYDMNVKTIFDPNLSDLSAISDYRLYVSLVTQVANIEVTEKGVRAETSPDLLIDDTNDKIRYYANKPFGFMIVDRKTLFTLFAGIYSEPALY